MTDRYQSNDAGGHREPITESLAQQYIPLPPEEEEEEGHRPEFTGSTSRPPTHEYVLPYYEDGLRPEYGVSTQGMTGSEPVPNPPAQEHLYPRSHEAQEPAPIMAVRAVSPFPQVPAFQQPVNMVTLESTGSLRLNGSGQDSRGYNSTVGDSNWQQARHPTYDRSSQYSRQGGNIAEASNSSAWEPLRIGSQSRAGQETGYPWNPSAAAQPAMNHDSRHDYPLTTSNAASYGETALPPAQTHTAPVPETSGPYRNQHRQLPPLHEFVKLPPLTESADSTRTDQGYPPPRHGRSVYIPPVGGKLPVLIPGPTQPLGPPLKPLDGPKAEAVAQEMEGFNGEE